MAKLTKVYNGAYLSTDKDIVVKKSRGVVLIPND